jgi:hypothetical protein
MIAGALLITAGIALCGTQEKEPVLAERAALAGLPGFMSVSTLTYHDDPSQPNELITIYVFPDRAVWKRRALNGRPEERTLSYRSGDACWLVGPGTGTSERLADGDRDTLVQQMELRRALTMWPDGFEWSGEGDLRTAPVAGTGSLVAVVGATGRPKRITSFDGEGAERESFSEIEWSEQRGRWFPRTFELAWRGTPIWTEEVQSIATNLRFLDYTFRPPDRRPDLTPELRGLGEPRHLDLRRATVRRTPLPAGISLGDALERAHLLWNEASRELGEKGHELEQGANFELSAAGAPTAIVLVVDGPALTPPPPGWTERTELPALSVLIEGLPRSTERLLDLARGAVPAGARAGTAFLRTDPAPGGQKRSQLVLPLVP